MRVAIGSIIFASIVGVAALGTRVESRFDVGAAEKVLVVIGGDFDSRAEATAAADAMPFGDVQGFYVVSSDDLDGEVAGRWLLASAFRTELGAAAFEQLAHTVGSPILRRILTTYRGSDPIGLGQEMDPTGRGPLIAPLPPGHPKRL